MTDDTPTAELCNDRGVDWTARGDFSQAIAEFTRAIELDGEYARAWHNRGFAHLQQEKFEQAIEDYTRAIELDPGVHLSYSDRGTAWFELGEYERAIEDYTRAIELAPDEAVIHFNRGSVYEEQQRFDKAIEDYLRATKLDDSSPAAFYNVASLWASCPKARLRNGKQAVRFATRAAELTEFNDWEVLDTLAAGYAECGNFKKAVHWQMKAVALAETPYEIKAASSRLDLYEAGKPYRAST